MPQELENPEKRRIRTAEVSVDRAIQVERRPGLKYDSIPRSIADMMKILDPAHNPDVVGPPVPVNLYRLTEKYHTKETILVAYSMLDEGYRPREVSKALVVTIDMLYEWVRIGMRPSLIPAWERAGIKDIPSRMPASALDHPEFQAIATKQAALGIGGSKEISVSVPPIAADRHGDHPIPVAPRSRGPMFPMPVATGSAPVPVGPFHPPALNANEEHVGPAVQPVPVASNPSTSVMHLSAMPAIHAAQQEATKLPMRFVGRRGKHSGVDQVRLERLVGLAGVDLRVAANHVKIAYSTASQILRDARRVGRIPGIPLLDPGDKRSALETEHWLEAILGGVTADEVKGAIRYAPSETPVQKRDKMVPPAMRDRIVLLAGRGKVPLGNIADFVGMKQDEVAEIVVAAADVIGLIEHSDRIPALDVRAIEIDLIRGEMASSKPPLLIDADHPSKDTDTSLPPAEPAPVATPPQAEEASLLPQPVSGVPLPSTKIETENSRKTVTPMMTLSIKTGDDAGFDLSLPVGHAFNDKMIEGLRQVIGALPSGDDVVVTLVGKEAQAAIWPVIPRIINPEGSVRFRFSAE